MKWIKEFFNRFSLKTGSFFQVIQKLSILCAICAGIPALLVEFQTDLGIAVPAFIAAISSKVVAWSAIVAWIIAKLPVKSDTLQHPATIQKLPFTDKKD